MTDKVRKPGKKTAAVKGGNPEVYEAQRKYPRLALDEPATLVKANEEMVDVMIHDLSIDGLQIRCDRQTAGIIHPSGKFIKPGRGPLVRVRFKLQVGLEPGEVVARCRIFYLTGIGGNQFAFGLKFTGFAGNGAAEVERYIMRRIEPVEDKVRSYLGAPRSSEEISRYLRMGVSEVYEMLERLKIKGEVVTYQDGGVMRNLRLSAALTEIFDTLRQFNKRLSELEDRRDRK
ncbi:MAG: PilZ domain-containing protein [Gammaproteobacteria bacterium]|jgi:hypothetical protein|nr:MAG: PilZ domain-containing protein [Gammaproteobacteria bacterium]